MKLWLPILCLAGFTLCLSSEAKILKIAGALKLDSNLNRRGATLYSGIQISPIFYLGLFDEHVRWLGTNVSLVSSPIKEIFRVQTKVAYVRDQPLFVVASDSKNFRHNRPDTWEWTTTLQLRFPNFRKQTYALDLSYAKDIDAHRGDYLEISGRLTLAGLIPTDTGYAFQPQLFASLGFGGSRHNEYQYGSGAVGTDPNNLRIGLYIISTARVDSDFPLVSFYYYRVLGSNNRSGSRVVDMMYRPIRRLLGSVPTAPLPY